MNPLLEANQQQARNFVNENQPTLLNSTANAVKRVFRYIVAKIEKVLRYLIDTYKHYCPSPNNTTLAERLISVRVNSANDMKGNAWLMLGNNKNCRAYRADLKNMVAMFPNANAVALCSDDSKRLNYSTFEDLMYYLTPKEKQKCIHAYMPLIRQNNTNVYPKFTDTSNLKAHEMTGKNFFDVKKVYDMLDGIFINIIDNFNFNNSKEIQLIIETPHFNSSSDNDNYIMAKEYILYCEAWMTKIQTLNNNKKVKLLLFRQTELHSGIEHIEYQKYNERAYDTANKMLSYMNEIVTAYKIEKYISTRIDPILNRETLRANLTQENLINVKLLQKNKMIEKKLSYNLKTNIYTNGITKYIDTMYTDNAVTKIDLNTNITFTDTNSEIQQEPTLIHANLDEINTRLNTEDFFKNTNNISIQITNNQHPNKKPLYDVSYHHNIILQDQPFEENNFLPLMNVETLGGIIRKANITVSNSSLQNELSRLHENSNATGQSNECDLDTDVQIEGSKNQRSQAGFKSILDNIDESNFDKDKDVEITYLTDLIDPSFFENIFYSGETNTLFDKLSSEIIYTDLNINITFHLPISYKTALEKTENPILAELVKQHGAEKVLLATMDCDFQI